MSRATHVEGRPRSRHALVAEYEALRQEVARRGLLAFTQYTSQRYEANWHHVRLAAELDAVLAGHTRRLIVNMPPQNGKALQCGTRIPTPTGWAPIEDLEPGDLVFAGDGTPTAVVAVSPVWPDRVVYRVEDDSGAWVVADEAHEWLVRMCRKRQDVRVRWETGELYARSQRTDRAGMVDGARALVLPACHLPIPPYTLGAWLGDGASACGSITQYGPDRDHVLGRIVSDGYRLGTLQGGRSHTIYGLQIQLRSLGLLGRAPEARKRIPQMYLRASIDQRVALLHGLVDTDGSVSPAGQVEFTSIKRGLAEDVVALVRTLGGKPCLHEARASLDGRDCGPVWRVTWHLDASASTPRKAERCRTGVKASRRYIQDISPAGRADTLCIQVAHPSHTFLAGDGLQVTCNSELVSRRFPAYALGRQPSLDIIHASYNADLARDMSRDVKRIIQSPAYRALFPHVRLGTARDADIVNMADQFDLVGQSGGYRAAGVGQGITGKSMRLGIIDDPIKSRAEAESDAYRRMVWNWYVSDFRTRSMGDDTAIVLVQTRWHEDDLAGRLLKLAQQNPLADQWRVLSLPAVLEEARPDDPRQPGEALWPTRFSSQWLAQTRAASGAYDWSALYQQQPVPAGGAMAQRAWFRLGRPPGTVLRRCRCWDLAGTKPVAGRDPDWTVGTLLARHADGDWSVEHVVRVRETPMVVDRLIVQTARMDGPRVLVREWQDPGAAGKSVVAHHLVELVGYDYEALPSSGEKSLRWRPFLAQAEGGRVWLADGPWTQAWLDEMQTVPYGAHDDQADSVAGAFNALVGHKDYGPSVAVVLPGSATASGPGRNDWQDAYFRR